jgi:hypothetical protein
MGSGEPAIARVPAAIPAAPRRVGALDPGPGRILRRDGGGGLPRAGGLQRLGLLPGWESYKAGRRLGPRAWRPVGTRRAGFTGKAHRPPPAVLGSGVRAPGEALLAQRTRHPLRLPVDQQVGFVDPRARPGLPPRGLRARAEQGAAVRPLAVHQDLRVCIPFLDHRCAREQVAVLEGRRHARDQLSSWRGGGRRLDMHAHLRGLCLTGLGAVDLRTAPRHLPLRALHVGVWCGPHASEGGHGGPLPQPGGRAGRVKRVPEPLAIRSHARCQRLTGGVGLGSLVGFDPLGLAVIPRRRCERLPPRRCPHRQAVQRRAQGFPHPLEPRQHAPGGSHRGGVRAVATAGLQEPLRPGQRQPGLEEEWRRRARDAAGAARAADGLGEAWGGQCEPQDRCPIPTAADRLGRWALGHPCRTREDRGQRPVRRRGGGWAARRTERRALCVVGAGTKASSDLEGAVPAREGGTGTALGFVRDRSAGVGVQGHTGTPSQETHRSKG